MGVSCPVCGDPSAFPLWVGDVPPAGCVQDATWHKTGELTDKSVRSVTECAWQMKKAWQAAEFRKLVPDAFDASGKMLPKQLARVLRAFGKAHPEEALVL